MSIVVDLFSDSLDGVCSASIDNTTTCNLRAALALAQLTSSITTTIEISAVADNFNNTSSSRYISLNAGLGELPSIYGNVTFGSGDYSDVVVVSGLGNWGRLTSVLPGGYLIIGSGFTVRDFFVVPDEATDDDGNGGVFNLLGGNVALGENCTFWNNSAVSGGAFALQDGASLLVGAFGEFVSNNCYGPAQAEMRDDVAAGGAAISALASNVYIDDSCTFNDNSAEWGGGAVFVGSASSLVLRSAPSFTFNRADPEGGDDVYSYNSSVVCCSPTSCPSDWAFYTTSSSSGGQPVDCGANTSSTISPSSLSPSAHPSSLSTTTTSPTTTSTGPSETPSAAPSTSPSDNPSATPSASPSDSPSAAPSESPSESPSAAPSPGPSANPTSAPSTSPSETPSTAPSPSPSDNPSTAPSASPSGAPTSVSAAGPGPGSGSGSGSANMTPCLAANSLVATDQGDVSIQEIVPGHHAIGGQTVRHVSRSTSNDPFMVRFPADAFGGGTPSTPVVLTRRHKILHAESAQLKPAEEFIGREGTLVHVGHTDVFNIVLGSHATMLVHNLTVETLHPENRWARPRWMTDEQWSTKKDPFFAFSPAPKQRRNVLNDDHGCELCRVFETVLSAPTGSPTASAFTTSLIAAEVGQLLATGNVTEAVDGILDEAIQLNSVPENNSSSRTELVALLDQCLDHADAAEAETLTSIAVALETVVDVASEIDTPTAGDSIALVENLISTVTASNTSADLLITESSNFTSAAIGSLSRLLEASIFGDVHQNETTLAAQSASKLTAALESLSVAQQQAQMQDPPAATTSTRWFTKADNLVLVSVALVDAAAANDGNAVSPSSSVVSVDLAAGGEDAAGPSFEMPLGTITSSNFTAACNDGVVGGASAVAFASGMSPYRWQSELEIRSAVASLTLYSCSGELVEVVGLSETNSLVMTLEKRSTKEEEVDDGTKVETCAWWNTDARAWDDSGCALAASYDDEVVCSCNHMTTFAIVLLTSSDATACVGDDSLKWQALYDGSLYHGFLVAMTLAWAIVVAVGFRSARRIRHASKLRRGKTPLGFTVNAALVPVGLLRAAYFAILAHGAGGTSVRCWEFPPPSALSRASGWAVPVLHDFFFIPFWSVFAGVICCWSDMCNGPIRRQTGIVSPRGRSKLRAWIMLMLSVTIAFSVLIGSDAVVQQNGMKQRLAQLEIVLYGMLSLLTSIFFWLVGRRVVNILRPSKLIAGAASRASRASGASAPASNDAAAAIMRITARCSWGFTLHAVVLWSVLLVTDAVTTMVLFSIGGHVIEVGLGFAMLRAVRPSVTAAWSGEPTRFQRARHSMCVFFEAQHRRFSSASSADDKNSDRGGRRRSLTMRLRRISDGLFAVVRRSDSNAETVMDLTGRPANVCSQMSGASIRMSDSGMMMGSGVEMMPPAAAVCETVTRNPLVPPSQQQR